MWFTVVGVLMLDPDAENPHPKAAYDQFSGYVKDLLSNGVKFYFCQNTVRGMKVKTSQIIPGVKYVTAGNSALAGFQKKWLDICSARSSVSPPVVKKCPLRGIFYLSNKKTIDLNFQICPAILQAADDFINHRSMHFYSRQ
jgi:hypothetical protein